VLDSVFDFLRSLFDFGTELSVHVEIAKAEERAQLESLREALEEFVENIVAWYNEVADLVTLVERDLRLRQVNQRRFRQYGELLTSMLVRDVYSTQCSFFLNNTLPSIAKNQDIDNHTRRWLTKRIPSLKAAYRAFTLGAHDLKRASLVASERGYSSKDRKVLARQLEHALDRCQRSKDRLVALFERE
jgi:hypothetical protein